MQFSKVLSPLKVGTMELRNRFVVPPMGTNFAGRQGQVTQKLLDYYEARAKGGFGLIIVEVTAVTPEGRAIPNEVGVWSDDHIEGLKKLADVAHKHGAKIALQLHHAGRQTFPEVIEGKQPEAPSPICCPFCNVTPRELSTEEVYALIERYGDAAVRAKKAGFDAVEVHGAHGYLIAQFMSAHSNKRIDEFGGDFISRMKFPLEIMKNIRQKVGRDYPVIFRFSADERFQDGIEVNEAKMIARQMEAATVDILDVSVCNYGSLKWMSVPSAVPPGYNLQVTEAVKKVVSIPVIAVGRINDPYLAEMIVSSGVADLVALGRESLCDPEFPKKVAENRIDEISPCIACEQSCHGYLFSPRMAISCLVNPFTGNEGEYNLEPAGKSKKVMVVGSGPAGMFAAWVAAAKGHQVVLYEKQDAIGGEFRVAALPPTKQVITKAIKYYKKMCDKYGVTFKMGTEVTEDLIRAEAPDVLILATGSKPLLPNLPGIDNPAFVTCSPVLEGKAATGQKILIAGGGLLAAETAEFLGERGRDVTIVEKLPLIAAEAHMYVRPFLLEALDNYGVKVFTDAEIVSFTETGVIYKKDGHERLLDGFDTVILAFGVTSYNPLEEKAKALVKEVYVIGDALKAGPANNATESALATAAAL